MKKSSSLLFLALAMAICSCQPVMAQVSVYPITVFTSSTSRFGSIVISNKSSSVQEVTVSFQFGYPTADSTGNIHMVYNDSVAAGKFSIASAIRSFPSRFILQQGQRQVVKMLITPPANAKNQVYWSRIVTHTQPQVSSVSNNNAATSARVIFAINYVTSLFYRNGQVNSATQINSVNEEADSVGTPHILVDMKRTGNAPLLGMCNLQVTDQSGKEIYSENDPIAVYFDMVKNFAIPKEKLTHNTTYNAKVTINAGRLDISAEDIFKLPTPVTKEVSFRYQ